MKTTILLHIGILLQVSIVHSATIKRLDFNTNGVMPRTECPGLGLFSPQLEETAYSVSGGLLHQNTYGVFGSSAYSWPNVEMTNGILDSTKDVFMETRLSVLRSEGLHGAYISLNTGAFRYTVSFHTNAVAVISAGGVTNIPLPDSDFHRYRIEAPACSGVFRFLLDGALVFEGTARPTTANGFAWGDGDSTVGYGAEADWDYVEVSQSAPPASAGDIYLYDASLGTLPEAQGFIYYQTAGGAAPTVNGAVLHMPGNPALGGYQFWYATNRHFGFATNTYTLEITLKVLSATDLSVDTNTHGFQFEAIDSAGYQFLFSIGTKSVALGGNCRYTNVLFNAADGFHTYRAVFHDNTVALFIDCNLVASSPFTGAPLHPDQYANRVYFGDGSGWATSDVLLRRFRFASSALPPRCADTSLVISNAGFEVYEPTSGWVPSSFGDWESDHSTIVLASDSGISPRSGAGMFKFLGTGAEPISPNCDARFFSCELNQLVDLSPLRPELDAGEIVIVTLTGFFNRVAGDAQTDTEFGMGIYPMDGAQADFRNRGIAAALAGHDTLLLSDSDPLTWEGVTNSIVVPTNATYLELYIHATENIYNNTNCPEFDGHFADDFSLTVEVPALRVAIECVPPDCSAVSVSWSTVPNRTYQLEYTTNLINSLWLPLGSPTLATGSRTNVVDAVMPQSNRFYRVRKCM